MTDKTWNGSQSDQYSTAANWTPSGVPATDGSDSITFNNTSDGTSGVNCVIDNVTNIVWNNITIASNFIGKLQTNGTVTIEIQGAMVINRADCLKFDGTNTVNFTGDPASVGIATYDGAGTAYTKALVSFGADASV